MNPASTVETQPWPQYLQEACQALAGVLDLAPDPETTLTVQSVLDELRRANPPYPPLSATAVRDVRAGLQQTVDHLTRAFDVAKSENDGQAALRLASALRSIKDLLWPGWPETS